MANFSSESVPFYSLASGPPRPGPGSLFPRRKSDQNAAGDTPVPDFCPIGLYQWGDFSATESRSFSNLQSGGQRYSACRPRRHKLRIPHPDASVRLRSLRCASFFLGKRSAGLPRSGPCGADLFSHWTFGNARGGIQRGTGVPLCVVAGVGFIGEGPHRKGPAPMRFFGYFLSAQKVTRVRAGEARELSNRMAVPGEEKCFSPAPRYANQPCIGRMRRHRTIKKDGGRGRSP